MVDVPAMKCDPSGAAVQKITMDKPAGSTHESGIHILSFFRTSPKPVTVGFELTDAAGQQVVAYTDVPLQDLSMNPTAEPPARRLSPEATQVPDFVGSNCEDFFLSD